MNWTIMSNRNVIEYQTYNEFHWIQLLNKWVMISICWYMSCIYDLCVLIDL